MKFSTVALVVVISGTAGAFQSSCNHVNHRARTTMPLEMASSLGKSKINDSKAAAIRAAEARNQAEIEALKVQISQLEDLFSRSPGAVSVAAPSSGSFVDTTRNQLGERLSEFRGYLNNLLQRSRQNEQEYDQIMAQQGGPSLAQTLATSVAAGTMGGLVASALDSNRRDSIGGIIAGVAGSAASLATSNSEGPAAPLAQPISAPVARDPRSPVRPRFQLGVPLICFCLFVISHMITPEKRDLVIPGGD